MLRAEFDSTYTQEPGRNIAREYVALSWIAEKLANRIDPNVITLLGAAAGVLGTYLLGFPDQAIPKIEQLSKGLLKPPKGMLRVTGACLLAFSYISDVLDGAVARKSIKGESKSGIVLDGIVNKVVDTSTALFALHYAKTADDKATWGTNIALAPVSTMIRSAGLEHGVPISKTGWGARIGRIPITVGALVFQNHRNLFGKILIGQFILDSTLRYNQIRNSGNKEAQERINTDLSQYAHLVLIGSTIPTPLPAEVATFGLELGKLAQVKIREACLPKQNLVKSFR